MDRRKALLGVAAIIAALGTILVFLYVRGADNRADSRFHAVQVLKAVKEIDAGETVQAAQAAGAIQLGTITEGDQLPGSMSSLSPISGMVATTTIYPGEQIVATKFGSSASPSSLTIPPGKIAVSVNLSDPGRVAGFVNPGDSVAIFMEGNGSNGGTATTQSFTRLLLSKVEVIGVGTTSVVTTTKTDSSGTATTEQLPRTLITLALTQAQAERVLYASTNGDLALGLLDKSSQVAPDRGVTGSNLFQ